MTIQIQRCNDGDLATLENIADAEGWDHIKHMVRNEQQTRVTA